MNILELFIYHLRLSHRQCTVFWWCAVDDFHQLDDGLFSAGYRISSHRHHDAGNTGLLHVGGVSRWRKALMVGRRAL